MEFNEIRRVVGFDHPTYVPTDHLVSGLRLITKGGHTTIKVFSRSGLAGDLVVNTGDAHAVALRLLPMPYTTIPAPEAP